MSQATDTGSLDLEDSILHELNAAFDDVQTDAAVPPGLVRLYDFLPPRTVTRSLGGQSRNLFQRLTQPMQTAPAAVVPSTEGAHTTDGVASSPRRTRGAALAPAAASTLDKGKGRAGPLRELTPVLSPPDEGDVLRAAADTLHHSLRSASIVGNAAKDNIVPLKADVKAVAEHTARLLRAWTAERSETRAALAMLTVSTKEVLVHLRAAPAPGTDFDLDGRLTALSREVEEGETRFQHTATGFDQRADDLTSQYGSLSTSLNSITSRLDDLDGLLRDVQANQPGGRGARRAPALVPPPGTGMAPRAGVALSAPGIPSTAPLLSAPAAPFPPAHTTNNLSMVGNGVHGPWPGASRYRGSDTRNPRNAKKPRNASTVAQVNSGPTVPFSAPMTARVALPPPSALAGPSSLPISNAVAPPMIPGATPAVVRFGRVTWSPIDAHRRDQVYTMAHAAWSAVPTLWSAVTDITIAVDDREFVEIVFSAGNFARTFVESWLMNRHKAGDYAVLRADEL